MVRKKTSMKTVNNKDIPLKSTKKKTELTELEKFYVEQKCREGVELDEIKKQDISPVALVEQLYNKTFSSIQEQNRPTAGKLMSKNEKYGSVVMTPASSEFGDNNRKPNVSANSEAKEDHIHKFR